MTHEAYDRLAEALNARSATYPSVPCDEFYSFASEIFTPEQAEIASSMPLRPTTAEELADLMKVADARRLSIQLEEMARAGTVRVREEESRRYYELLPLVPGIVELQFMHGRVDDRTKRLAKLMKSYGKALKSIATAIPSQPAAVDAARVRRIPVGQEVSHRPTILPYEEVVKLIEAAEHIAAGTCVCRHQGDLLDRPCDRPKADMCMVLGPSAEYASSYGPVRLLTREEARRSIDEAEAAGLVHLYANSHDRFIDLLCACCGCHCLMLRGVSRSPFPSQAVITDWLVTIDEDACSGCGCCIDRCWMAALQMDGDLAVRDAGRCIGCGLCMYVCPSDAMRMVPRQTTPA